MFSVCFPVEKLCRRSAPQISNVGIGPPDPAELLIDQAVSCKVFSSES